MLRKLGISVAAVAFFVVLSGATEVRSETVNDQGVWLALFAQDNLGGSDRLKWWFDGHLRFLDDANGFHQSIVRPGIGWSINDQLAIWAGYGWIQTEPLSGSTFAEHRAWQQATWSRGNEQFTFALRSRLEQRFLETGDDTGWRFRQLVRFQHHLPELQQLSFVTWDEAFFHLNDTDWGATAGFDQNRAFVGFGWNHGEGGSRTEFGYLNQWVDIPNNNDRANHILSINFYH